MPRFTTRVELHHGNDDDYVTLHDAMRDAGFSRIIADSDGVKYHLPTAEYNSTGNTKQQELDRAKAAAESTGRSFSILVTHSAGRTWYGLRPVSSGG
jgi:hypothetical protein